MLDLGKANGYENFEKMISDRTVYKIIFGSSSWLIAYQEAKKKNNLEKMHQLLQLIFEETINIVNLGYYYNYSDEKIILPSSQQLESKTVFYDNNGPGTACHISKRDKRTWFDVDNIDCLDFAREVVKLGENPVVLNMANRRNPGGGVHYGARAQEESIFRRTNLYRSLYQFASYAADYKIQARPEQYPLDQNYGGIYSPKVTVFRENEDAGFRLLDEPFQVSIISIAAINRPTLDENGKMDAAAVAGTLNKIRTMCRIALLQGHDSMILSAFGCGAFRNPPEEIARLFHQVLEEEEFNDKFKWIVFAIKEDHNSKRSHNPRGNFLPFKEEFLPDYSKLQLTDLEELSHDGDSDASMELRRRYDDGICVEKNSEKSFEYFMKSLEQGGEEANFLIAKELLEKPETEVDVVDGIKTIRDLANGGYVPAIAELARIYGAGLGVKCNEYRAEKLLRKAAEANFIPAQLQYAELFVRGISGFQPNYAFHFVYDAAKTGDSFAQYHLGKFYELGYGIQRNETRALTWIKKSARQGNPNAQFELAEYYFKGFGLLKQDFSKGLEMLLSAVEQGHASAQLVLAKIMEYEQNLPQNPKESFRLVENAAQVNDCDDAYFILADYLTRGYGCKTDLNRAFQIWEKLASGGDLKAQFELAVCLLTGKGTEKDVKRGESIIFYLAANGESEALKICRVCAENDNSDAQHALARYYTNKNFPDYDLSRSIAWEQKAAANNNANALFCMACAYKKAICVADDPEQEKLCMQKAFEMGEPGAITVMAENYYYGQNGFPQNNQKALELFQQGAEAGVIRAVEMLGQIYLEGIIVPQDVQKGMDLLEQAADADSFTALHLLGTLYFDGKIVPQDKQKAFDYWECSFQKNPQESAIFLGMCYEIGVGCEKDIDMAIFYYEVADNYTDNPAAAYELGRIYFKAQQEKAIQLMKRAADGGFKLAQDFLCWFKK